MKFNNVSNLKTKVIVGLCSMLFVVFSVWASVTTTIYSVASGKTSITTSPALSSRFSFLNTNAASTTVVYVYDAPGTNVTYVTGAYTNYTYGAGSVTNLYTNYMGVLNSNIYTALIVTTNSVPAATNYYRTAGIFQVSSNGSSTAGLLNVNLQYQFQYGILITNNTSVSATVDYGQ